MQTHIFKPDDMAMIVICGVSPEIVGMQCIVDSHPYAQMMRRPDNTTYIIQIVDITIGHPIISKANVECLKYIPPEEWKPVFTVRELVPVEITHEPRSIPATKERREPATTESACH